MSGSELVIYKRTGKVVELRLNRPEKLNALSNELIAALGDALYRFHADDDGWVAILSGEGRAFCSGADGCRTLFTEAWMHFLSRGALLLSAPAMHGAKD